MDILIRVSTAAELYGCDRRRIYQMVSEGRLASVEVYGVKLVDAEEVARLSAEIKPRGMPRKNEKFSKKG